MRHLSVVATFDGAYSTVAIARVAKAGHSAAVVLLLTGHHLMTTAKTANVAIVGSVFTALAKADIRQGTVVGKIGTHRFITALAC